MSAAAAVALPEGVRALVVRLAAEPAVVRVLLFGSRTRGDGGPRADVNLAVEAPGLSRRAWRDLLDLAEDARTLLLVNLVWLDEAPPRLREEILEDGVVLHERARR